MSSEKARNRRRLFKPNRRRLRRGIMWQPVILITWRHTPHSSSVDGAFYSGSSHSLSRPIIPPAYAYSTVSQSWNLLSDLTAWFSLHSMVSVYKYHLLLIALKVYPPFCRLACGQPAENVSCAYLSECMTKLGALLSSTSRARSL